MCGFGIKMYAIICVPLDTPTILYLNHHRAVSDGWKSDNLCDECWADFRLIIEPFVVNCTSDRSCGSNVCLRQPPSLRNLTSHTVFHLAFNSSSFTLTEKTLHHQYVYTLESNVVPHDRLVPLSFSHLICYFVRSKHMNSVNDFKKPV